MSQECVENFIGRLITDDSFRKEARRRFSQVCLEQGFVLTRSEEAALGSLDYSLFDDLAAGIDCSIRRCEKGSSR